MIYKRLLLLYTIPYVYIGMWLLWLKDAWYTTLLFILLASFLVFLGHQCNKRESKYTLILGNIINSIISITLVRITNCFQIVDSLGGTWEGYFKPFYLGEFVCVVLFVTAAMQFTGYWMIQFDKKIEDWEKKN